MKPGQNSLVALTALKEMACQLSQQNFSMAPNQSLIQFLSILPESEYAVEKRLFCNRLQPDREQILITVRSGFENLYRQRKKGVGRKDAGHAFVADTGGKLDGKHSSSSSARGREKEREVVVGEGAEITVTERRKNNTRRTATRLVRVEPTVPRKTA